LVRRITPRWCDTAGRESGAQCSTMALTGSSQHRAARYAFSTHCRLLSVLASRHTEAGTSAAEIFRTLARPHTARRVSA
jgi:hypothetical protein